jgi:hypothetical protein
MKLHSINDIFERLEEKTNRTKFPTFHLQLKHYAAMRISLGLDDGVKANYGIFGNLLADVKNIYVVAHGVVK